MTNEQIQALQALAERATKGPWTVIPPEPYDGDDDDLQGAFVDPGGVEDADGDPVCAFGDPGGSGHLFEHPDNPPFIAAAREAVPALCAALLAAREQVADHELTAGAIHSIREMCRQNDVPEATFIDDCVANAIIQRNQAREENEQRRKSQSYAYIGKDGKTVQARDLEDERDALRARVERLTEALRPFAQYGVDNTDDDGWTGPMNRTRIVDWFGPSDFRRARTAMEDEQ